MRNSLWKRSLSCEKSSYSVLLSCWYSRTRIRHGQRSWNRGQWYLYIFVLQNITPVSHLCHRERRILVNLGTCYCWKKPAQSNSRKKPSNDWMIIYFNGVYVPSRCLHVVQRTGVSGRPGQSGGTSVLLFFLLPWVCYQYTADREKVSGKQVQPLCDDRECLRKGYWFYSRFAFHKFSNCEKSKSAHRQIPWQTASEKAECQEVQHLG